MPKQTQFSEEVVGRAKATIAKGPDIRELRAAQAVLLPSLHGLTMEQTASILGVSRAQVGVLQMQARGVCPAERGAAHGGRRREMMSVDEEKAFLEPWAKESTTAGMVIVPPLHEALEKKLGRIVHSSQVYRLLARHGWRKIAPDSIHPKTDLVKQDEWKKNSRKWYPSASPSPLPQEKDRA